jgi:hypothetical protein
MKLRGKAAGPNFDGNYAKFSNKRRYGVKQMGENNPLREPNCLKCLYFKVTWEPDFPRSCKIFGIKCRNLPSVEVLRATGHPCPAFQLKEGIR